MKGRHRVPQSENTACGGEKHREKTHTHTHTGRHTPKNALKWTMMLWPAEATASATAVWHAAVSSRSASVHFRLRGISGREGERESEVEATIGVKAEDGVLKKTLNGKKWYIKTRSQTVLLGDDDDNNIGNLGQLKRKRGQSGREGKREREVTCFGSISISTLPVVMLARLLLLH